MGNKLYVGNLAFTVTDASLETLFAETGTVHSAKVIMDRETGRSKGFGFVEMSSETEAKESIKRFDGQSHDGRPLKISEAKPQAPRESSGGFGGRSSGNSFGRGSY